MALVGSLVLASALVADCNPVKMENKTNYAWNESDQEMLVEAKRICRDKRDSCVKAFIKIGEARYKIICEK